jgi:hypothetical protein
MRNGSHQVRTALISFPSLACKISKNLTDIWPKERGIHRPQKQASITDAVQAKQHPRQNPETDKTKQRQNNSKCNGKTPQKTYFMMVDH